jgi:hypothetical protein
LCASTIFWNPASFTGTRVAAGGSTATSGRQNKKAKARFMDNPILRRFPVAFDSLRVRD